MNISEKVAYIKGLAEGLNVDDKVVNAILDVLADIANAVNGLKEDTEYLENYIEEVDEDLGALEEDFYELGDVVVLGNSQVLYYLFPKCEGDIVAKIRIAQEELYKIIAAENAEKRTKRKLEKENAEA